MLVKSDCGAHALLTRQNQNVFLQYSSCPPHLRREPEKKAKRNNVCVCVCVCVEIVLKTIWLTVKFCSVTLIKPFTGFWNIIEGFHCGMVQEGCVVHLPLSDWAKARSPHSLSSRALPSLKLSSVYREPARNRTSTHSGGWTPVHDFLMIPELLPRESLNIYWKELKAEPQNGDCVLSAYPKGETGTHC